jgi:hypothetical protein
MSNDNDAIGIYDQIHEHIQEKVAYVALGDDTAFDSESAAKIYAAYCVCGSDADLFAAVLRQMARTEGWD